VAALVVFEL